KHPEKSVRVEKRKTAQRKADIYTERVTIQISPDMRDSIDSMARELQRSKTSKEERITANTVVRVAVQVILEHFEPDKSEIANTEQVLFRNVVRRLNLK